MRSAFSAVVLAVAVLFPLPGRAADSPESELRGVFERFVAAQNAHDAKAVGELLWDQPGFLWITRGTPIWGREAALQRFEANYAGTWKLDPDMARFRATVLDAGTAQVFVPVTFTIGPPGKPAQAVTFHMNQVLVRTPTGWKVASILPIPVPVP
jgi:ketosteroid isomerase-like protein